MSKASIPPKETLGPRLQRLRAAAGMSQSELAAAAGVPIGTIRNWEHDRRGPLFETAIKIAVALGVSLDELGGISPENSPGRPRKGK
jgi:transcriptional regulator with XRE-family HTH domain